MLRGKYRTKFEVLIDELTSIFTDDDISREIRVKAGRLSMDILDDLIYLDEHRMDQGTIISVFRAYHQEQMDIYKQI